MTSQTTFRMPKSVRYVVSTLQPNILILKVVIKCPRLLRYDFGLYLWGHFTNYIMKLNKIEIQ